MSALLPTLAELLGILAVLVVIGFVLDHLFPAPASIRRWMFAIGTIGVPIIVLAVAASGFTPPIVLVASMLGVFATTIGLPLIALRSQGTDDPSARGQTLAIRLDTRRGPVTLSPARAASWCAQRGYVPVPSALALLP